MRLTLALLAFIAALGLLGVVEDKLAAGSMTLHQITGRLS